MNVKKHKWLVWAMLISLMLGIWDGSVAKGEENNPPVATGKVGQITQVKLMMEKPVGGGTLPSEVRVETSAVESAAIERPAIETVSVETISWESGESGNFSKIDDLQGHKVESNKQYKVTITLKTEKFIFKDGVEVWMGESPDTVFRGKIDEDRRQDVIKVSWTFTPKPTPVPTTSPTMMPVPTPIPTVPPTLKPTSDPDASPTIVSTATPAVKPSVSPTALPTMKPTTKPTQSPSASPVVTTTPPGETSLPASESPTDAPSVSPSPEPTGTQSPTPDVSPSPSATATSTVAPITKTNMPQQDNKTITKIHVNNVKLPRGDERFPNQNLKFNTVFSNEEIADEEIVKLLSFEWRIKAGDTWIEEKGEAKYNETYQLWITLTVTGGYKIKDGLEVSVDGEDIAGEYITVENGKVTIKFTFSTGSRPTQSSTPPTASLSPVPVPSVSPSATYTVTLDANGGKFKNTKQKKKTITFTAEELKRGAVEDLPMKGEITKKGCIFIGWYEGKKPVEKITESRKMTLKAQWVQKSVLMQYPGEVLKWTKFKLSKDVKLTYVSIKKYKSFVEIDQTEKTIKAEKYFKKAELILTINGKKVKGVVLKIKFPEVKVNKERIQKKRYVTGVYTTYKITYVSKPKKKAVKAVAIYSRKEDGKYKPVKELSRLKGGLASVKQRTKIYIKVRIYYGTGKKDYSESKHTVLRG